MYVKVVKYKNVLGEKAEKKLYFNISKLELTKLDIKYKDIVKHIQDVVERQNGAEILDLLDELIKLSYGEKNDDGYLVKTQEVYDRFRWSEMYDELVLNLLENPKEAESFFTKITESIRPNDSAAPKTKKK